MNAHSVTEFASKAEVFMWLAVLGAAIYGKAYRAFGGLLLFICARAVPVAWYDWMAFSHPAGYSGRGYQVFVCVYWVGYFLSVTGVLLTVEQILRRVFSPLPGLSRLSVLMFRATAALAIFIALTAHVPMIGKMPFIHWLDALSLSFLLCMCVFELALMLALLAYARRLGLSLRTRVLGISAGLCMLGVADILSALNDMLTNVDFASLSACAELITFLILLMWFGYFILPDQPRGPLLLHSTSTLMRWNEIVSQLGSGSGNQEPVVSFMSEVESVVERIMLRNTGRKS